MTRGVDPQRWSGPVDPQYPHAGAGYPLSYPPQYPSAGQYPPTVQFPPAVYGYPQPGYGQPGYGQPGYGQPGYAQPGYAQPGYAQPWPGQLYPGPPAKRRRRWLRVTFAVLAIMVATLVGGTGALLGYASYTGALSGAQWQGVTTSPGGPPAANASRAEWSSWARRSIDVAVHDQAQALLAADESGFLAVVDASNATLVAEHRRRYRVLRAMGLGAWTEAVSGALTARTSRAWRADLKINYCFGDASCLPATVVVNSQWEFTNDRLVLADLDLSTADWNGPRPWEVTDLTVARGQRVVIAATKTNAWRLPEAVKAADRAASVADQFADWADAPSRFVIFLAGPSEWRTWYGAEQADWAAAWAVPVGTSVTEVVIRTQVVAQRELELLLTHELTHVTSLAGPGDPVGNADWWLVEGLAEYATMQGKKVSTYRALSDTRTFVKGSWDGDPAVAPPRSGSSLLEASGRYGVAFLAVRRISDRYGQGKMLAFFGAVIHDDDSLDSAARSALGVTWTAAGADCASYIRHAVG